MDTQDYRKGVGIVLLNNNNEVFIAHRHQKGPRMDLFFSLVKDTSLKHEEKNEGLKALDIEGLPPLGDYLWQMPQGGIDEGESVDAAALRELKEETGIHSVQIIQRSKEWFYYDIPQELPPLKAWGRRYKGQCQKWFLLRFMGKESEINLNLEDDEEFNAWRWISPEVLPDLVVPFKRDLYKKILQDFDFGKRKIGGDGKIYF